jgi:hypothetical protein
MRKLIPPPSADPSPLPPEEIGVVILVVFA